MRAEKDIGALLVVEENRLVGVITIGDLVKALISKQKVVIDRLEKRILSRTGLT